MKKIIILSLVYFLATACASHHAYKGVVADCKGNPIPNAKVEAWKNQWLPFHLPIKLGASESDDAGLFTIVTDKKASFFVYSGKQVVLSSHPSKSESTCVR